MIPPVTAISLIDEHHHAPPSATINPLFEAQNQPPADELELSTTILTIQDHDSNLEHSTSTTTTAAHIAIAIGNEPPFLIPNPKFYNFRGILYLMYGVALIVMYPSLAQLTQLKFQNNQNSPFDTHSFFAYTTVVTYVIAILSSVIMFYLIPQLENSTKEGVSRIYYIYVILKSVFYFSSILAPLSLVLVLLVPPKFNWIGYIIIFVLFLVIVACNINDYKQLLYKKDGSNVGDAQRN